MAKDVRDPIIAQVIGKILDRSDSGFAEYGVTLDEAKAPLKEWLIDLQEELLDASNYIQKIINIIED